ncbi:MAG: molybdopterin molybdotransferase MoeA [Clostridia bacterium]|jgi:molybdopterin molybdotransferase|nr:molybdopterin molybdotransferase MoeA [Clostridia bacterium]MBT7122851.1 molybdopterin molybdotransferase MoeA [Clostridia bacterium]
MEFFNVKTIDRTRELMKQAFDGYALGEERVDIENVLNRVLASDVRSDVDVPHFDRSVVDGYAVRTGDADGASESVPAFLKLIGSVQMGEENTAVLRENECMYVPTGGMVPKGTQAMVMIEHAQKVADDEIAVYRSASMYENMLRIGDDIRVGEMVLTKGKRLYAQDIGALSSTGHREISVYKRPKFAVLSTGDEIISPDSELTMGKIKDINTFALAAQIESFGGEVAIKKVVVDDFGTIKSEVEKATEKCDVVLVSGGSSVGEKDYTYEILKELSGKEIIAHGLNIKPGKPTIVADVDGKPVIGLPGQPASALMVLTLMLDILHEVFYKNVRVKTYVAAKLDQNVASAPGRKTFQMVQIAQGEHGKVAKVIRGKSGMISLLSKSYGYFVIESSSEGKEAGEAVNVYPLQ